MATLRVSELGEYIRDQRRTAQISLRQLAKSAGVSNPYLSQIERGLRKPSAEILQQIAKALRISAEALYVQAGFLEDREESDVKAALLSDSSITERQKQVLAEIYDSFRKENALAAEAAGGPAAPGDAASAKKSSSGVKSRSSTTSSSARTSTAKKASTASSVKSSTAKKTSTSPSR